MVCIWLVVNWSVHLQVTLWIFVFEQAHTNLDIIMFLLHKPLAIVMDLCEAIGNVAHYFPLLTHLYL